MPTFNTPEPICVTVDLGIGNIRIEAGNRTDTVVEVRPGDPSRKGHVSAVERTRVDYADGRLRITGPKNWRQWSFQGGDSVHVYIALPAASELRAEAAVSRVLATGRLGECGVTVGVGEIRIEEAGSVHLTMGTGDIVVGRAAGHTEITVGLGAVRVDAVTGTAAIRNSNGETWIGEVTGDLRVKSANGKIGVDRAGSTVTVRTANGAIRLGEVHRGVIVAETGYGSVEVGVADGVAAWLDLDTRYGTVRSDLDPSDRPTDGEPTVEVRAHSATGDVTIRRAAAR